MLLGCCRLARQRECTSERTAVSGSVEVFAAFVKRLVMRQQVSAAMLAAWRGHAGVGARRFLGAYYVTVYIHRRHKKPVIMYLSNGYMAFRTPFALATKPRTVRKNHHIPLACGEADWAVR